MIKKTILLVAMFLIILGTVEANTLYEYFETFNSSDMNIIYGGYESGDVYNKIDQFLLAFGAIESTNYYSGEEYVPSDEGNVLVIGTYIGNEYIYGFMGGRWPLEGYDAFMQLGYYKGYSTIYITGDRLNSTLQVIDYAINYRDHADELNRDVVLLNDGKAVDPKESCTVDSDDGNPAVVGVLEPYNLTDMCIDNSKLREFSCEDRLIVLEDITCDCLNGACVQSSNNLFKILDDFIDQTTLPKTFFGFIKSWISK